MPRVCWDCCYLITRGCAAIPPHSNRHLSWVMDRRGGGGRCWGKEQTGILRGGSPYSTGGISPAVLATGPGRVPSPRAGATIRGAASNPQSSITALTVLIPAGGGGGTGIRGNMSCPLLEVSMVSPSRSPGMFAKPRPDVMTSTFACPRTDPDWSMLRKHQPKICVIFFYCGYITTSSRKNKDHHNHDKTCMPINIRGLIYVSVHIWVIT